jgi:hypothetical protein
MGKILRNFDPQFFAGDLDRLADPEDLDTVIPAWSR